MAPGRIRALLIRWLALALLLAALPALAERPLSSYFREAWSSRDGLPHNLVNDVLQTPDGYLWLATWEGAVRYNGYEFVVFDRDSVPGLPDHGFRALAVGQDGALLLGSSRGGVAIRDAGGWRFLTQRDGLAQDELMDLLQARDGSLWLAYESAGVGRRLPDGSMQLFDHRHGLPDDVVYSLAEDPLDAAIWVGTAKGLARIDVESGRVQTFAAELPQAPVYSLHVDARDRLLAGGERGVFEADGDSFRRIAADVPVDPVQRVFRDRAGAVWFGSINRGLFRTAGDRTERLGVDQGLPNARVAAIYEDAESSVWIGTNGGLFRLRDAAFSSLTREQGLGDDYVRTVVESADGGLWLGSSTGLARVHPDGRVEVVDAMSQSILSLAVADPSDLWIGTYASGLWRWRDGQVSQVLDTEHGLAGNQVRALLQARDGNLWIGTSRGLSRLRAGELHNFGLAEGLPREFIIALHEDRNGVIWAGTANGLARFDDSRQRFERIALAGASQDVFGFADGSDGALWLSTDRGLVRLHDGKSARIGYAQGLPVETLFQVVPDGIGGLWLSSNRGVIRITAEQAAAVAEGRADRLALEQFGELDGMASAQCNGGSNPASVLRRDGSIGFATARGLASVQPQRLGSLRGRAPPAVIERFSVDDRDLPVDAPVRLAAGTRRIEFKFAGLSFLVPQKIRYRYRLEGFDQRWVEREAARTAQFTNLPPGQYRFRVQAANAGDRWSAREAIVDFEIASYYWQHPGFWFATLGLLATAVVLAFRLRVARLRRAEIQLRALVSERTADLKVQTDRLIEADREKSTLLEQLREQSDAFARQAREDELTGLGNRRHFHEVLAREFARARSGGGSLSVLLLDIDWFKKINDQYSHAAGDEALRRVARVLLRECRGADAIARFGGEEFVVLCAGVNIDGAEALAERLRQAVSEIDCEDFAPGMRISVSIGIAEAGNLGHYERLISQADAALYRAKASGRNRVCR